MTTARHTGRRPSARQTRRTTSKSNVEERTALPEDPASFDSLAMDLLTVTGSDGCFKRLAPRFAQAFGYTEAELLDRPSLRVYPW